MGMVTDVKNACWCWSTQPIKTTKIILGGVNTGNVLIKQTKQPFRVFLSVSWLKYSTRQRSHLQSLTKYCNQVFKIKQKKISLRNVLEVILSSFLAQVLKFKFQVASQPLTSNLKHLRVFLKFPNFLESEVFIYSNVPSLAIIIYFHLACREGKLSQNIKKSLNISTKILVTIFSRITDF